MLSSVSLLYFHHLYYSIYCLNVCLSRRTRQTPFWTSPMAHGTKLLRMLTTSPSQSTRLGLVWPSQPPIYIGKAFRAINRMYENWK